jgi:hypothetical protein
MSPSDAPDFDNMSPEEMMRWMETLAKRQGADESGFVTDASASVNEVDPDAYDESDFGPGYVPFGEENKQPKKTEDAKPAPPPVEVPPEPEPTLVEEPPVPIAAQAADDEGTPDFDSMSPDEMMRWMETLAKRQGADESGFMTDASANVNEIDPDSVSDADFGPGYVPFGEENKQPKQPAAEKRPVTEPEPVVLPPEPKQSRLDGLDFLNQMASSPEPTPAASTSDDDMGWLDNLAEATTPTQPDLDLPDLGDLDSLTAELGDVLESGQPSTGGVDSLAWLEGLASSQPAIPDPGPPLPEEPAATAVPTDVDPLSGEVDPMQWLESLAQKQGVNDDELITGGGMDIPDLDPSLATDTGPGYSSYDVDDEGVSEPVIDGVDPEAWLAEITEDDPDDMVDIFESEPVLDAADPESWLSDMAGTDEVEDEPVMDATDPSAWLGDMADDPEFTERVPQFDPNPAPVSEDRPSTGDPIADALNAGEDIPAEDMEQWLAGKMDQLLEMNKDPLVPDEEPVPVASFDPDAPAEPGELPDWMAGLAPDPNAEVETIEQPAADIAGLEELFTQEMAGIGGDAGDLPDFLADVSVDGGAQEPSPLSDEINVPDMPDWLKEDPMGDSLDSVFAGLDTVTSEQSIPEEIPTPGSTEVDATLIAKFDPAQGASMDDDQWVVALDSEEDEQGDTPPDWYIERINDPDRQAEVESMVGDQLETAEFPQEVDLEPGQREPIPDWLVYATGAAEPPPVSSPVFEAEAAAASEDMPDWLMEPIAGEDAGAGDVPDWISGADADEVPEWLLETLDDEEESAPVIEETPEPTPEPVVVEPTPTVAVTTTPPPPRRSPVPVPQAAQINVAEVLQAARAKVQQGNTDEALIDYESIVRANDQLDTVIADMSGIIKANKENAAAYRVLGDALMRQGKLQAALDTYRRALNML